MKLLVGLGNPGREYSETRHNVGFWLVDRVASSHKISTRRQECCARVGRGVLFGIPILIAKPSTFMNRSGRAVRCLLDHYGLTPSHLVVAHADLDIPVGRYRVKKAGGDAGHRGVQSIIAELETGEFTRVRLGIGRPPEGEDPTDYVLSPFTQAQRTEVCKAIEEVVGALEPVLAGTNAGR